MKKSKRLLKLLELVPDGSRNVFDVGCDHGILSALLINEGKAEKVYASDISELSLQKTKILKKKLKIDDKIECIVSDGLNEFDKDVESDCVIIAGMGGNEIVKILSNIKDYSKLKSFLFQPAQDFYILRNYLSNAGFKTIKDEIIEDKNKFYANILCSKAEKSEKLSSLQCYFGKFFENDISVDFVSFVNYTYTKLFARKDYLNQEDSEKLEFCKKFIKKD